jgi:hypothetical protein
MISLAASITGFGAAFRPFSISCAFDDQPKREARELSGDRFSSDPVLQTSPFDIPKGQKPLIGKRGPARCQFKGFCWLALMGFKWASENCR